MQFKNTVIAAALLCAASSTMAAKVTGFVGAGCTGTKSNTLNLGDGCATFGSNSVKSYQYSGVTGSIKFFKSGGPNDNCKGTPSTTRTGSGCATAPDGFNWESALISS